MDHLTPGYREHRLTHPQRAYTARILVWATLGAVTGLLAVLCAQVAPDALVLGGLLAGILFGATR